MWPNMIVVRVDCVKSGRSALPGQPDGFSRFSEVWVSWIRLMVVASILLMVFGMGAMGQEGAEEPFGGESPAEAVGQPADGDGGAG